MDNDLKCPYCGAPIDANFYFCPNCGKQLRIKPAQTSVMSQIGVYLLSFFLPPLGLWPAYKYLKQSDGKSKMIGWIAVALTVISLVLAVWLFQGFTAYLNQSINNQLNSTNLLY
ncbi:MAG: zinc ribbon domain-containing protein [Patescibacteria group bacterium]|nr:zinc ribbon domain-containing protein [Patescibacteria group bacterium]